MRRYTFHLYDAYGECGVDCFELADDADAIALSIFVLRDCPRAQRVWVCDAEGEELAVRRRTPGDFHGALTILRTAKYNLLRRSAGGRAIPETTDDTLTSSPKGARG